jgi:hypothetical protein
VTNAVSVKFGLYKKNIRIEVSISRPVLGNIYLNLFYLEVQKEGKGKGKEIKVQMLIRGNEETCYRFFNGYNISISGLESREYGHRDTLTMWHPLSANVGTNFADKRRSLS